MAEEDAVTELRECPYHKPPDNYYEVTPGGPEVEVSYSSRLELHFVYCYGLELHFVYCYVCGAQGPKDPTEEGAIDAWNRRHLDAASAGGWVSVEERLPDRAGTGWGIKPVQVFIDYRPEGSAWQEVARMTPKASDTKFAGKYEYQWDLSSDWHSEMVTHWRPMPEPPA